MKRTLRFLSSASRFDRAGWSAVARLLAFCGPTHITGFIVAVVVYPIKGQLRGWLRSYVREESRKITRPFRSKLNPACAIIRPLLRVRIIASIFRTEPSLVFRGWLSGTSLAVTDSSFYQNIHLVAAATFRVAGTKISAVAYDLIAAVTPTEPSRTMTIVTRTGYYQKPDESLIHKVY